VLRFQRGNGDQCLDSQTPGSTGISAVVQKPCLFDGSQNVVFIE
jgi:hypothetical protein